MNKTKRVLITFLISLGIIGLSGGLLLQISFEPTSEAFADEQLGKKIVAASIAALITGILITKNKQRYKIVWLILIIIVLLMLGSALINKYSSKQSQSTNVSGAQSKDLLSKNEHHFSIFPADSSSYKLTNRKYQNAKDSVLESSYTLKSSMHVIKVEEFKSKHAPVLNCDSSGANPCIPFRSDKGLVGCFKILSDITCQYYPDNNYIISITSSSASKEEIIVAVNALSPINPGDILLTQ